MTAETARCPTAEPCAGCAVGSRGMRLQRSWQAVCRHPSRVKAAPVTGQPESFSRGYMPRRKRVNPGRWIPSAGGPVGGAVGVKTDKCTGLPAIMAFQRAREVLCPRNDQTYGPSQTRAPPHSISRASPTPPRHTTRTRKQTECAGEKEKKALRSDENRTALILIVCDLCLWIICVSRQNCSNVFAAVANSVRNCSSFISFL